MQLAGDPFAFIFLGADETPKQLAALSVLAAQAVGEGLVFGLTGFDLAGHFIKCMHQAADLIGLGLGDLGRQLPGAQAADPGAKIFQALQYQKAERQVDDHDHRQDGHAPPGQILAQSTGKRGL